jgi:hypothetical protein
MTHQELEIRYNLLSSKVKDLLDAQQAYFKSNKDFQLLRKSKALEQEVRNLITPKAKVQQGLPFEFLAQ